MTKTNTEYADWAYRHFFFEMKNIDKSRILQKKILSVVTHGRTHTHTHAFVNLFLLKVEVEME